jgi:hypothetical protein
VGKYKRGKEDPFKIGEMPRYKEADYVWALKDINFSYNKAEILEHYG